MWWRYRNTKRLDVEGGIKLQSRRGESAQSWWGRRWNEILYQYIDEGRLSRGRTYARRGQVISMDIRNGAVRGVVQGSMSEPYESTIMVDRLSSEEWGRVADALMTRPAVVAKMMTSRMPEEMEEIFGNAGLSLFPKDVETECSCYDWENPCKHTAAVYLIMSQQLDRDPLLMLRLRGMDQKELLEMMGVSLVWDAALDAGAPVLAPDTAGQDPLPVETGAFWGREGSSRLQVTRAGIPSMPAALPRRLGVFPFWRSEEAFMDALDAIYKDASGAGMAHFLADDDG